MNQLVEYIEKYYPKGLNTSEDKYFESPEFLRLQAKREEAKLNNNAWEGLKAEIKEAYPSMMLEDTVSSLMHDAAYVCRLWFPNTKLGIHKAIVVCVSIIAPYYMLYYSEFEQRGKISLQPVIEYEPNEFNTQVWQKLTELVLKHFNAYELIPAGIASQRVENYCVGNNLPGEAVIADYIFTDNIW